MLSGDLEESFPFLLGASVFSSLQREIYDDVKLGLPIKFLFDDDEVSGSLCDEEGDAGKV